MNLEPLERFALPEVIRHGLKRRGIHGFTPPQAEALRKGLLKGKNIVVSTPTASGKTLIAELALVSTALNNGIGIYATPLKALANEKYEEFRFWERYGVSIGITTGDYDEPGENLGKYGIIVATYERLDSILRHRPSWLNRVKTIVIDELHSINDPERGPIVELIATRALFMGLQIIGLSATVGNPHHLAKWLNAELVYSEWRPVKLIEGYYDRHRNEIVFEDGRVEPVEHDLLTHIALRAMNENYQVLIFKQARRQAEQSAAKLAPIVERFLEPQERKELQNLISELKSQSSSRIEYESLAPLIQRGVAFHHAGLSSIARKVVEKGFRERLIKIVVATPTLAAGINMPARRVVVYTRRFESSQWTRISIAEYKQMAGRAGRPQYDPYGEAIIADAPTPQVALHYIRGVPENVESKLWNERALRIHVLSTIVSGYANRLKELIDFFSKTLGAQNARIILAQHRILSTIRHLQEMEMIYQEGEEYLATPLGEAVSKLYVDPLTANIIIRGLRNRSKASELYYLTLIALTPDFERVRIHRYSQLYDEAVELANIGEIPSPEDIDERISTQQWLRGYKIARILYEWINEVEEDTIVERYGIGLGDLSNIVDTATWLTHAAARICSICGLEQHARALTTLSIRIEKGVREDAVDLARVKGIGRVRARILINAGIRTVHDLVKTPKARLISLPYFGEKVVEEILRSAKEILNGTR